MFLIILLTNLTDSTVRSIVVTSSIVAATSLSNKGEIDETCWNEESIEKVKDMKPGQLSFLDQAEVYCASKSLAEKGRSI